MRFLSKVALVALLALGVAASGHAQGLINPLLPVRGTREIAFRGFVHFEPDEDYEVFGRYGVFLNDARLQVGGELGFSKQRVVTADIVNNQIVLSEDDTDRTTLGAFVNYHFPSQSQLLPFVGAFIGFETGSGEEATSYGAEVGAKYFLNSSVAGTASLVYRDIDEEGLDNELSLQFGLAFFLR